MLNSRKIRNFIMFRNNKIIWCLNYSLFIGFTLGFLSLFTGVTTQPAVAKTKLFKKFDGYWRGKGSIIFTGGQQESLQCRATYFPSEDGLKLRQNIRCASPSYKVTASSDYIYNNGNISGTWIEKGFELKGSVSGKAKGNSLDLFVRGETFTAKMSIALTGCKKFIKIAPEGVEISLMSLSFQRC